MSEKIKSELISRRGAISLLGWGAALSLAVPATLIPITDAQARVGNAASAVSGAGANRRDRHDDRRSKKKQNTRDADNAFRSAPNPGTPYYSPDGTRVGPPRNDW